MLQTAALHNLQTLDSQIDQAIKRAKEIDRLLNENEALRQAQARHKHAVDTHNKWQAKLKDIELERQQLRENAEATEKRLYSGKILNPREMTDLQDKLAELIARRERLEDPIIEAMLETEEAAGQIETTQAEVERITAEFADTVGALTEERKTLAASAKADRAAREQARADITPQNLRTYDMLRKKPGGIAVISINANGECEVCGVQITSSMKQQVRRGSVITCPTCGRILYHP